MHRGEPLAEARQPFAGQGEGFEVAVDAEHAGARAGLQDGLGVTTHPQRGIDHDRARLLQRRSQQLDDAVPQDRDVKVLRGPASHHRYVFLS